MQNLEKLLQTIGKHASGILAFQNNEGILISSTKEEKAEGTHSTADDVFYVDNYIQNRTDCGDSLQHMIDVAHTVGGAVIQFGEGDYFFHNLILRSGVILKGAGRGHTVLHRLDKDATYPKTAEYANKVNKNFMSNAAFILIPQAAANIGIEDLSIVGVFRRRIFEDSRSMNNDYQDSEVVDGIKFEDFFDEDGKNLYTKAKVTNENPKGHLDNYEGLTYSSRFLEESSVRRCYKNCLIRNVMIRGFSGHGIYVGKENYSITFRDFITVNNLMNGIQNNGSDNFFCGGYIEGNGRYGIYDLGGNCKFSDLKVIWNGECFHDGAGIYCQAARSTYVNVEIQDNYCTGLYLGGRDNICTNIVSDCNGYRSGWNLNHKWVGGNTNTPQDCYLIYVTGKRNQLIGLCAQYNSSFGKAVAKNSLKIEKAKGCWIQITDETKSSAQGALLDDEKLEAFASIWTKDKACVSYIKVD